MVKNKQVNFRLDEESYRIVQMYALQEKKTIQDFMETIIKQALRGGHAISNHLLKVLQQTVIERPEDIKRALYEGFRKSLYFNHPKGNNFVSQVIIDEYGDIRVIENEEGWVPKNVRESLAYILYEFKSNDILGLWINNFSYDYDDIPKLLEGIDGAIEDAGPELVNKFAKWLLANNLLNDKYDYSDYSEKEILNLAADMGPNEFLDLIHRWNPKIYGAIKSHYLLLLENNPFDEESQKNIFEYSVQQAWEDILSREFTNKVTLAGPASDQG